MASMDRVTEPELREGGEHSVVHPLTQFLRQLSTGQWARMCVAGLDEWSIGARSTSWCI